MSFYFKNIKPDLHSGNEDEEDDIASIIRINDTSDAEGSQSEDELKTLSFGSLKKADEMMDNEEQTSRKSKSKANGEKKHLNKPKSRELTEKQRKLDDGQRRQSGLQEEEAQQKSQSIKMFAEESFGEESDSDSDGGFFDEESNDEANQNGKKKKGKRKHAPTESSSKKKVRSMRKIPGLEDNKSKSIYQDVRFDKAMGKSEDLAKIRQRYKFLDEYREKEINELDSMLHDRKFLSKISDREKSEMEQQVRRMKSRLETVQVMEMEQKIVKDYEAEINKNNKNKYHLKDSEKRKVIQKWKFEHMKGKQREKVMDRKRKKRLGKEFKQFEFHKR
ncbi:rRNA-processing protein RRP36 [Kluyveromyces lactis]|uniref:rRNA biogenesis protein RRP36 n=1 Tax=Kluyveromyces lactis (strain ATCC 8585 / CBS 2359 / DSM 70799 / NBRC 1267 / NRRL Y-1140 / WM37) TaxID=284590 RepID=RRP36_KLULA|nr:uncharacterized protein KLLA0_C06842g [Kluyveromyces lactis]Q6CU86.1 RecName: Full=rRNA biogenesis protein RRP36; AltName: Full=Ribosomal RNA-processing protein 36 [Kluyveromyces lactis NRRL Y-1140]CAH01354.1 KLLA0C06842p [Kluyveromyces lactis]|eukprot:XP_452503.1 uncharacterized protein KLLA0_C06842g [Kluyveromyces lactis]